MLASLLSLTIDGSTQDPSIVELWLTPSTFESVLQLGGLTLLAFLFATGRILTKGQHEQRVADLVKYADAEKEASDANHTRELQQMAAHHLEVMGEKDRRFDGMKESRDAWRDTARVQTERADQATMQLLESNELAALAVQQIQGIEAAARAASPGDKGAEVPT